MRNKTFFWRRGIDFVVVFNLPESRLFSVYQHTTGARAAEGFIQALQACTPATTMVTIDLNVTFGTFYIGFLFNAADKTSGFKPGIIAHL